MSTEAKQTNTENAGEEVVHEQTLFAEPVFHIGNFTVTNSLLNSWISVAILVIFFIAAGRNIRKIPRGVQNVFEAILEGALKFADTITGDRKKSTKFMPMILTIFLFILTNNWMGLIPGVGTIGFIEKEAGHQVFVPLFRGATADLNTTLALALLAIVSTHIMGVMLVGGWSHLNKFINIKTILDIPKHFSKDKTVVLLSPIKFFVGALEIVGEFSRVASLSFRLFGNIFAGEVLLASMMALFAFLVPLPFVFLEIFVGIIQAMVFSILTLVFMTINAAEHEH